MHLLSTYMWHSGCVQVNEENSNLSDELKIAEANAGDIDNSLKAQLKALRENIKEEYGSRTKYNVCHSTSHTNSGIGCFCFRAKHCMHGCEPSVACFIM